MHYEVYEADQARGMVTDLRARRLAFENSSERHTHSEFLLAEARRSLSSEALDLASRAYVWGLTASWPVDELVAFAFETDSGASESRAWRAFSRRRCAGARFARRNPAFLPRERILGILDRWRSSRWLRTGL